MILVEEARAIIGWDMIDDLIRNEEFVRSENDNDIDIARPLQALTDQELVVCSFIPSYNVLITNEVLQKIANLFTKILSHSIHKCFYFVEF